VLVTFSALIPAVLLAVAGWLDYQTVSARAHDYVLTTTNALAEQAKEALQTANLILARTLDHVEGMNWETINASREVHDFLARVASELPQVQSVFLVDPQGFNSASSRAFPMERFDNRQREYFIKASSGETGLYVASAFLGQMTGRPGFTVSRPRVINSQFDGVAVVTLSPTYFQTFYEKISLVPEASVATLLRTDGGLLARYPKDSAAIDRLPASSPLLQAVASGAESGVFHGRSSIDGHRRIGAFRRIEGQPLLAYFGLNTSAYLYQWYIHLAWMGGFAVLTSLALTFTSLLVLRQASKEEAHLRLLLAESERRKAAEEKVQYLQKMEALGRLSSGVAHDFNNLLSAVIGALELALKRIDDPERVRRFIGTALQAAQRGARLTGQMLAFSRSRNITTQPISINEVISDSDALIRRTVEPLVRVSYNLDQDLWLATADRVQLEVALLNLAGNARDAMPLGGELVFMTRNISFNEKDAPRIQPGDYVQLSASDTGEGMTKETLARAFDPFFTTKDIGKGTGLGLSQIYGFAEQLGGGAEIISAPGEGTTVTIWLPRAQSAIVKLSEEPVDVDLRVARSSLKILLVDDDDTVRSLAHEMLEDCGHTVTAAENGRTALAMLHADIEYSLLLTDFAMPVMNGAELAQETIQLRPQLPILFMTGYADRDGLKRWIEAGYRVLKKPFTAEELDKAIRQMIGSSVPG